MSVNVLRDNDIVTVVLDRAHARNAVDGFGMSAQNVVDVPMLPFAEKVHIQFAQLWCETVGVVFNAHLIVTIHPTQLIVGG